MRGKKRKHAPASHSNGPFDPSFMDMDDARDRGSAATAPVTTAQLQLQLATEEGRVYIEQGRARPQAYLVHGLMYIRVPLPAGGPYFFVWDQAGFGAVADASGMHEPIMVSEAFPKILWCADDGELFMETKATGEVISLSNQAQRHEAVTIDVRMLPLGTAGSFSAYKLAWPRAGCFFFWHGQSLYTVLSFKTYKGVSSLWVFENKATWRKFYVEFFNDETHFVDSFRTDCSHRVQAALPLSLPTCSLSTAGVLALLTRWTTPSPKAGGLRKLDDRRVAKILLDAFARIAGGEAPLKIPLRLNTDWMPTWPARDFTEEHLHVVLHADGSVDVAELLAANPNERWFGNGTMDALATLQLQRTQATGRVDFTALMEWMMTADAKIRCLGRQLVVKVAFQIEQMMLHALRHPVAGNIWVRTVNLMDLLWDKHRLDAELIKHCLAARDATVGVRNATIASDEVHVGGPNLMNSVLVLASNLAIPFAPAVRFLSQSSRKNSYHQTFVHRPTHRAHLLKKPATGGNGFLLVLYYHYTLSVYW